MKRYIHIVALFFSLTALGQTPAIDSLRKELNRATHDSTRALVLLRIGFRYYQTSSDSLMKYTRLGRELSLNIGFEKGIGFAYNNLGTLAYVRSEMDEALEYYQKFLKVALRIGDKQSSARAYNNLGIVYMETGNYPKSLDSYKRSLEINESRKNFDEMGQTFNNMGSVYLELGDYGKALETYLKALEIKEKIGNEAAFASSYDNVGNVYRAMGELELAKHYYELAVEIFEKYNQHLGVAETSFNLGSIYRQMGEYDTALENLERSVEIANQMSNQVIVARAYKEKAIIFRARNDKDQALSYFEEAYRMFNRIGSMIGTVETFIEATPFYMEMGMMEDAKLHARDALMISRDLDLKKGMSDASKLLSEIYTKEGNYQRALEYLHLHKNYYDSLNREGHLKEMASFESRYEIEKITTQNEFLANQNRLNEATIEKSKLQIERQNLIIFGGLFLILLSFTLAYISYRYYRSRKHSIELLEKKNQEIVTQSKVLAEQAEALIEVNEEIKQMNESLEEKVKKRTARIQAQNEKLKEYAFSNAHLVRAPLARILGLTDQLKTNETISDALKEELNNNIFSSAEELDQVIRKVNKLLSEEDDN